MKKRAIELGLVIGIMVLAVYVRSEYILDENEENKYLLGYDPYFHYRAAESIVETGERPEWDTLANAPEGKPFSHPPLFHYALAYTYKIFDVFSDRSFFDFAVHFNILMIIACTGIAFLTGKELTNSVGGLFTASLFAVSNAVVKRSIIGFTDTDLFVVFFSFLITFFWLKAINNRELQDYRLLSSGVCGFSIFLYYLTWQGYFYMLSLVLAATVLVCLIEIVRTREIPVNEGEILGMSLLGFFVPYTLYELNYLSFGVLAFITLFILLFEFKLRTGAVEIVKNLNKNFVYALVAVVVAVTSFFIYKQGVLEIVLPFQRYGATGAVKSIGGAMYPTTDASIREMYQTDLGVLYSLFGITLLLAPLGIIFSLWRNRRYSYAVYFILFLIGTYSMLTKGGRFSLIMAVPMILASTLFLGDLYEIIDERVSQKKVVSVGIIAMIILAPLVLVPSYVEADENNAGQREMTEGWWKALNWMSGNTPEDATIISWWDYGYWIQAVAERKTTMDGGHYGISHKLVKTGKLYSTTSEEVAVKEIYGFDLNSTKEEALDDMESLRQWSKDPELAKKEKLKEMKGYAEDNAYVIVDEKTASIFSWIGYYGAWDHNKGEGQKTPIYRFYLAGMRKRTINDTECVEYIYQSGNTRIHMLQDFNNNFHAFYAQNEKGTLLMGTVFENNGKNYLVNKEGGLGVAYLSDHRENLRSEGGTVYYNTPTRMYLLNPEMVSTMFSRLLCFDGANLSHFELVKSFDTVKIYKVHKEPQKNLNEDLTYREDEFFKNLTGKEQ